MSEVVRSARRGNFFIIENGLIDHFLEKIGSAGVAIYCILSRYADKSGATFVGAERMGRVSGLAKSTIDKALRLLVEHKLVKIVQTEIPVSKTVYHILPVPYPKPPAETPLFDHEPEISSEGAGISAGNPEGQIPSNKEEQDLQANKTHNSNPAPSGADRDNHPFPALIEIIDREYSRANDGDKCPWQNKRSFKALGDLLKRYPKWTVDRWEICIVNRYLSDGYMTTRLEPWEFIPQLYKFADGPLNQYGKKLDSGGARGGRTAGSSFVERARREIDFAEQLGPSVGGEDVS